MFNPFQRETPEICLQIFVRCFLIFGSPSPRPKQVLLEEMRFFPPAWPDLMMTSMTWCPFWRLAQEAAPGLRPLALFGSERPQKLAASGANMTCPSGPGSPACSDDHSDLDFSLEINEVTWGVG